MEKKLDFKTDEESPGSGTPPDDESMKPAKHLKKNKRRTKRLKKGDGKNSGEPEHSKPETLSSEDISSDPHSKEAIGQAKAGPGSNERLPKKVRSGEPKSRDAHGAGTPAATDCGTPEHKPPGAPPLPAPARSPVPEKLQARLLPGKRRQKYAHEPGSAGRVTKKHSDTGNDPDRFAHPMIRLHPPQGLKRLCKSQERLKVKPDHRSSPPSNIPKAPDPPPHVLKTDSKEKSPAAHVHKKRSGKDRGEKDKEKEKSPASKVKDKYRARGTPYIPEEHVNKRVDIDDREPKTVEVLRRRMLEKMFEPKVTIPMDATYNLNWIEALEDPVDESKIYMSDMFRLGPFRPARPSQPNSPSLREGEQQDGSHLEKLASPPETQTPASDDKPTKIVQVPSKKLTADGYSKPFSRPSSAEPKQLGQTGGSMQKLVSPPETQNPSSQDKLVPPPQKIGLQILSKKLTADGRSKHLSRPSSAEPKQLGQSGGSHIEKLASPPETQNQASQDKLVLPFQKIGLLVPPKGSKSWSRPSSANLRAGDKDDDTPSAELL